MSAGRGLVALLTDFGTRDWYAAALKGVILSRLPRARLVDITHEIPPQDVVAGGFTLAAAAPYFPEGTVFLAVVDPGVGTSRALLAAQADGRRFVGPDNGLLAPSLARARARTVVTLANRRFWGPAVSRTFHGRDIMAPVAAFLARGGSLRRLGPVRARVRPLPLPAVAQRGGIVAGAVVHIDAFGNLITNLEAQRWLPLRPEGRVTLRYRGRRVPVVSSYADGRPGELVAVVGSLGLVEFAVPLGSAAARVRARRGDPVILEGL
jgi:S-adenosylmethionine hydrolase